MLRLDLKAGRLTALALSSDGQILATGAGINDSLIKLWDVKTGSLKANLDGHRAYLLDFAFSLDGRWLASASADQTIQLWDWENAQSVATLRGCADEVWAVAFAPDGRRLATGSTGREAVRIWDVETQMEMITLEGEGAAFQNTVFSPDGNWLISLSNQGLLHLWRAPSWAEIEAAEAAGKKREER